jgi:hypothetical protein
MRYRLPLMVAACLPLVAHAAATLTINADRAWKPDSKQAFAPHGAVIYPIWTAQNVWKPWRQWVDNPPVFAPYLKEAALVLATGARPFPAGGIDDIPDLYREGPDGSLLPFDPEHSFFKTLLLLRKSGITPLIDMGPVPLALCPSKPKPRLGAFEFGVEGPADSAAYRKYHGFVKALFLFLQGPGYFTVQELEKWEYQLLREPDNPDGWDPKGTKTFLDPGNYREYQKLYDWTLAAMRGAGLRVNLDLGNLAVPHPGNMGRPGSWMEPLCKWVNSDSASSCPYLKLPRLDPRDNIRVGFTAYGGCQLGADPEDLAAVLRKIHGAIRPYFPKGNVRVYVGEGNLTLSPGNNRGDGTERGAAWNAAVFKAGYDGGLHRFQQWGFSSGSHLSQFEDGTGLMSPAFNVVRMFGMMEGSARLDARLTKAPFQGGARVDGLAAKDSAGVVRVLAYHYQPDFRKQADRTLDLALNGMKAGGRYRVTHYRVDRERGNYFRKWLKDLGGEKMAGDTLDALVGFQLTPSQRTLWERNRPDYDKRSRMARGPDSSFEARASRTGILTRRVAMPANSVSLFVLEPAR